MGKLHCDFRAVGMLPTNCYFLWDEDTKEALIIDPAYEKGRIHDYILKKQLHPQAILITHGHFDHITEAAEVKKLLHVPIYAPEAERDLMKDAELNASIQVGRSVSLSADEWLQPDQELLLIGHRIQCIHTPGHTSGSMCFYFLDDALLISGDTLFQGSVGRTDLPTGSTNQILSSLREKLLVLPDQVQVYPGHGMMTTISDEKKYNPYRK